MTTKKQKETKPETLWVEFEAEERNTLSLEGEMDEENSCGDFDTVMYSIKRKFGAGLDDNSPVFICKKHLDKLRAASCNKCNEGVLQNGLICGEIGKARAEGMAQGKIMGLKEAFNKRPFSSDEDERIGYATWLMHEIRKIEPNFHKAMPQEAQKQEKEAKG